MAIQHTSVISPSMKRLGIVIALLLLPEVSWSQVNLSSRRQPVTVQMQGLYQHYESERDSLTLSEMSAPLYVLMPLSRRLTASLYVSGAQARATDRATVTGMTDVQVSMSYVRRMGSRSLVFNMGANVPVGSQELSAEEFDTTVLLSSLVYDFRVPGFGRGLSLSPGVTYAFSVREGVVLGVGVSYLYKGSFRPTTILEDSYAAGDELLLTGGLDVGLSRQSSVSLDVTYSRFGVDRLGDMEVYASGDRLSGLFQYRWLSGFDMLRVLFRGRLRGASVATIRIVGTGLVEEARENADDVMLRVEYRRRLSDGVYLGGRVRYRGYGESSQDASRSVLDVGLDPEYVLSRVLRVTGRVSYRVGSVQGYEAGLGITAQL